MLEVLVFAGTSLFVLERVVLVRNLVLLATLATISSCYASDTCEQMSDNLSANYELRVENANHHVKQTELTLWRQGSIVAHEYPVTGVTESWQHVKKNLIKPVRYFDNHKRAIEYQPGESIHGKTETDWTFRNQLISDSSLAQLTKTDSKGSGCETEEVYRFNQDDVEVELVWLPAQKLVKSFIRKSTQFTENWTLKGVEYESQAIDAFFATRENYMSTDFADIGDDHTDPFLTRMVTLGFIETGASGFYDDKGNALEGGHHHHH